MMECSPDELNIIGKTISGVIFVWGVQIYKSFTKAGIFFKTKVYSTAVILQN